MAARPTPTARSLSGSSCPSPDTRAAFQFARRVATADLHLGGTVIPDRALSAQLADVTGHARRFHPVRHGPGFTTGAHLTAHYETAGQRLTVLQGPVCHKSCSALHRRVAVQAPQSPENGKTVTFDDLSLVAGADWGYRRGGGMTMVTRMSLAARITSMQMPLILGSMVSGDPARARKIGMVMHFVNALIFGLIYGAVWFGLALTSTNPAFGVWVGAVFGAVHGIVVAVMMPMIARMHPRAVEPAPQRVRAVERVPVGVGGGGGGAGMPVGEVRLSADFGVGGSSFGKLSPAGLLMAHVIFGAIWGVVFTALV